MAIFNKFFSGSDDSAQDLPSIFSPVFNKDLADSYFDFYTKAQEQFAKALEFQQITFEKFFERFDKEDDDAETEDPVPPSTDEPADDGDGTELPGTTPGDDTDDIVPDDDNDDDDLASQLDKLGENIDNSSVFDYKIVHIFTLCLSDRFACQSAVVLVVLNGDNAVDQHVLNA
ncbi:MAG: hypothetical protein IJC27_09560, partial [Lentisphaeria bacterium]|nr:hypothetical protein [Lentisphaeria bacterium]